MKNQIHKKIKLKPKENLISLKVMLGKDKLD